MTVVAYLHTYLCPRCNGRISLPDEVAAQLDAVSELVAALKACVETFGAYRDDPALYSCHSCSVELYYCPANRAVKDAWVEDMSLIPPACPWRMARTALEKAGVA